MSTQHQTTNDRWAELLAPFLTTSQAARALGLSEGRTRQLGDRGQLRVVRTGGGLRLFAAEDVARFVRERAARIGDTR